MSSATLPAVTTPDVIDLATTEPVGGKAYPVKSVDNGPFAMLYDRSKFEQVWSIASVFSKSNLVPQQFQNNAANCFIACQLAHRLGMDPFMLMQNAYVVHGKPGFEGKFVIALVNNSGIFADPIEFEWEGNRCSAEWTVTAKATRAKTGKVCTLPFRYGTAIAEGWVGGNPKWKNMPEQMMMYRAAAFFARVYCPEVLMGMQTREEIEDVGEQQTIADLPTGRSSFRNPELPPKANGTHANGATKPEATDQPSTPTEPSGAAPEATQPAPKSTKTTNAKAEQKPRERWTLAKSPAEPGYFRSRLIVSAKKWRESFPDEAHDNDPTDMVNRLEDGHHEGIPSIPGPNEVAADKHGEVVIRYKAALAEVEGSPDAWKRYVVAK